MVNPLYILQRAFEHVVELHKELSDRVLMQIGQVLCDADKQVRTPQLERELITLMRKGESSVY